ncbi:MAG: hypothetical protein JNJ49_07340 [Bdellovibrionaceae bacterium]|nr:hypothetical protein [Pseudobdellovibrionaceae bacterium]
MPFLAILILFSSLTVGCVSSRKLSEIPVVPTDETQMQSRGCASLGIVEGSSSLNGPLLADTGKDNAKTEALQRAELKGATHIVWNELELGILEIRASGKAYSCR